MVEMVTVLNWSNTTSTEKTDTFYLRAYQKFVIHVTNVYTGSGSPHIKVLEPDGLTLVDVPISTPMDFSEIVSNKQGTFTFKSILCSGFIQAEANRPNPSSSFYAPTSSTLQAGQSYTIKWYAATDDDGDVDFYRISYSLNGSTTWNPIEQTANTQITFTIPSGTTIQFSVQAWDKTQLSSGYTYSQIYTVETNQPPTTPSQFYNPASELRYKQVQQLL
jgi:hypothetical protein